MNELIGPIFVVGNSRSGTTMMAQILGRHSRIFSFNELHFFEQLWTPDDAGNEITREEGLSLAARLFAIQREGFLEYTDRSGFAAEAAEVISRLKQGEKLTKAIIFAAFLEYEVARGGKEIGCEQTPRNVFYINEIRRMFPNARFVNMVRDPRAVMLSQKNKWRLRQLGLESIPLKEVVRAWANYHPFVMAKLWHSGIVAALRSKTDCDDILDVQFEKLVREPEVTIGQVCSWLGIDFAPDMLNINYWGSSREKTQAGTVGIKATAAAGWRQGGLCTAEIAICESFAFPQAANFGYKKEGKPPSFISVLMWYLILPAKLGLAFLLNLHRMKNIGDTLRRRFSAK